MDRLKYENTKAIIGHTLHVEVLLVARYGSGGSIIGQ
jgi:hypothetical protein